MPLELAINLLYSGQNYLFNRVLVLKDRHALGLPGDKIIPLRSQSRVKRCFRRLFDFLCMAQHYAIE